jgi:O-antigen ligase
VTPELQIVSHIPAVATGPLAVCQILFLASTSNSWMTFVAPLVLVAVALAALIVRPRFRYFLFLIFLLICWFPEFSQTEWEVFSAQDAPSIYNFRPIPTVTASVFDYLFATIVLFWLFKYVFSRPRALWEAPFAKSMLALFAICAFNLVHGVFRGNEVYYALREFRVGAYFVLTYLMLVTVCDKPSDVRQFIRLNMVMAAIIGVYGVFRFFLGIGKEFGDVNIVFYDIADSMVLYMAMLFIAAASIEGMLKKGKAFSSIVVMLPVFFTFLFSYRRGAWVAFGAGFLFLLFLNPQRSHVGRKFVWRMVVPASVILALIAMVPTVRGAGLDFVMERITSIFDTGDTSNAFRILDAFNAVSAFVQHPLVGVGGGGRYDLNFISEVAAPMEFWEDVNRTSHNGYLYILFKMGAVGFLVYFLLFLTYAKGWLHTRKLKMGPSEQAVFMALGAIVFAFLVNNVTEPVSDTLRPSLLLSFAMAWGATWMNSLKGRAMTLPLVVQTGRPNKIEREEPRADRGL